MRLSKIRTCSISNDTSTLKSLKSHYVISSIVEKSTEKCLAVPQPSRSELFVKVAAAVECHFSNNMNNNYINTWEKTNNL